MCALPPLSSDTQAIHRGYNDDGQEIKSNCPERILDRLQGRSDREENIQESKVDTPHEEKNDGMNQRERNRRVGSNSVSVEDIDVTVRPVLYGTVSNRH